MSCICYLNRQSKSSSSARAQGSATVVSPCQFMSNLSSPTPSRRRLSDTKSALCGSRGIRVVRKWRFRRRWRIWLRSRWWWRWWVGCRTVRLSASHVDRVLDRLCWMFRDFVVEDELAMVISEAVCRFGGPIAMITSVVGSMVR